MKCYETVWEIFNLCSNNQMRDVFIEELEIDDTDAFIQKKFKGREVSIDKTVHEDGTIIYDIVASGLKERYSFTELE
jgi:hypothetical protein